MEVGNLRGQLPVPKAINNAPLAMVLYMCGAPFTTHEGVIYPGFNFYSDAFLAAKGYKGKSRTLAIQELWKRGIHGQLVYQFERKEGSDVIEEISKGWDGQSARIKAAQEAPAESRERPYAATETLRLDDIPLSIIGALCRQLTRASQDFYGDHNEGIIPIWQRRDTKKNRPFMPAMKAIEGASRVENDPETRRTTVYGSINLQEVKV